MTVLNHKDSFLREFQKTVTSRYDSSVQKWSTIHLNVDKDISFHKITKIDIQACETHENAID